MQQRRFLDTLVAEEELEEEEESPATQRPPQEWPAVPVSPHLRRYQVLEAYGLSLAELRALAIKRQQEEARDMEDGSSDT